MAEISNMDAQTEQSSQTPTPVWTIPNGSYGRAIDILQTLAGLVGARGHVWVEDADGFMPYAAFMRSEQARRARDAFVFVSMPTSESWALCEAVPRGPVRVPGRVLWAVEVRWKPGAVC